MAISGSSNFAVNGLGLAEYGSRIDLNLVADSTRDHRDLKAWFEAIWSDDQPVEDVKADVLAYLAQLYQANPPASIYFKTLFPIFEDFLTEETQGGLSIKPRQA